MALTVEDGTGVAGANTYQTLVGVRAYALDRNIPLSTDDVVLSAQLVLACDYIESFAARFVGQQVSFDQALSWPRKNVQFDPSNPFPDNEIPSVLKDAQSEAVIAISQGIVLQPSNAGSTGFVTFKKVGPIEKRFSETVVPTGKPLLPKVKTLLAGLLNPGTSLPVIRV